MGVREAVRVAMGAETPTWLPEELKPHVNGSAEYQTSVKGRFVRDGDGIYGELVRVESATVGWGKDGSVTVMTVRAAGGQMDGEPIEPGTWVRLRCSSAGLVEFAERARPREGETVVVVYGGLREVAAGIRRHVWTASVVREGVADESW